MTASRRKILLTTAGLSGTALAAGVAAAPSAEAATGYADGTVLALGSISGIDYPLDLSLADTFTCTVTGPTSFTFKYSGTVPGTAVAIEPIVIITQDSSGGHAIQFSNATFLPAGSVPVFPSAAGQTGIICFLTPDFGTTVYGQGSAQSADSSGVYGDGSDGAIVLDGTNKYGFLGQGTNSYFYWAQRDIYASSLTINSGATLQLAGGGTPPFRLFCSGPVTINSGGSIVTVVNTVASGAAGGTNLTWGTLTPGAGSPSGSSSKTAGAVGGDVYGTWPAGATYAGGAGGANSSGTAGGAGGSTLPPPNMPGTILPRALPDLMTMSLTVGSGTTGTVYYYGGGASGGAGAGDGTDAGGAGGPGGNTLFIAAQSIVNNGTIQASGGAGGNGTGSAGGGGGGQGGPIVLIRGSYTGSGTKLSPGGAGGAGGTGASKGVAGTVGGAGWIVELAN